MLIRRVVPAIVATLAVYAGLAFAAGGFLRQHYLAPLVTSKLNVPGFGVDHQPAVDDQGRPAGQPRPCSTRSSKGTAVRRERRGPEVAHPWQYLVQHGYTQWTTYQPASRFWPFQWIEGGWLLALSVLLIAVTVWLVRRRAT